MGSAIREARGWLITAICLFLLAFGSAGTLVAVIVEQRANASRQERIVRCQTEINNQFLTALGERAASSDLDRRALRQIAQSGRDMIAVLLRPDATQQERITAVSTWQQAQATAEEDLRKAEENRSANPLPLPQPCS